MQYKQLSICYRRSKIISTSLQAGGVTSILTLNLREITSAAFAKVIINLSLQKYYTPFFLFCQAFFTKLSIPHFSAFVKLHKSTNAVKKDLAQILSNKP